MNKNKFSAIPYHIQFSWCFFFSPPLLDVLLYLFTIFRYSNDIQLNLLFLNVSIGGFSSKMVFFLYFLMLEYTKATVTSNGTNWNLSQNMKKKKNIKRRTQCNWKRIFSFSKLKYWIYLTYKITKREKKNHFRNKIMHKMLKWDQDLKNNNRFDKE